MAIQMNANEEKTAALAVGSSLEEFAASAPTPTSSPQEDIVELRAYTTRGVALIAPLPPKIQRTVHQQQTVEYIHLLCRKVRTNFMHSHAAWLYDKLTNGRTVSKRLDELVFGAADIAPGLVPSQAQMMEEQARSQPEKEGLEIDQGIFFWGLLRLPEVGDHLIDSMLLPSVRACELLGEFSQVGRLDLGSVLIERKGCAAHLTVQNDSCLNAEDNNLADDMETAVDLALLDSQVRVGVLRGGRMTHPRYVGRRVFSAGINLKHLHQGKISFVNFLLRREFGYVNKLLRGLVVHDAGQVGSRSTLEKPWIAAVDSFAIGGGAQLLLVVDRVIASSDTYICLPAAQEGIIPGVANLRLRTRMGGRLSRRLILSGERIWATALEADTLIDEVVDQSRMDAAIDTAIEQLDSAAVIANRRMLNLSEEPVELFRAYMAEFALEQARRLYAQDVIRKVARASSRRSSGQALMGG